MSIMQGWEDRGNLKGEEITYDKCTIKEGNWGLANADG